MKNIKPIELITSLRQTDEYIKAIFTHGSCYKFHLFLKSIWPEASPYMTPDKQHVVTRFGTKFYDINGLYSGKVEKYVMKKADIELVKTWSFKKQNLLKLTECKICGEPFVYEPKTKATPK